MRASAQKYEEMARRWLTTQLNETTTIQSLGMDVMKIVKLKHSGNAQEVLLTLKTNVLKYVAMEKWLFPKKDFEMMAMMLIMMAAQNAQWMKDGAVLLEV